MDTLSVIALHLLASLSFPMNGWSLSTGSITNTSLQSAVFNNKAQTDNNISLTDNNSRINNNSLPSDKQQLSNDSIINDEIEKLENSGYLLFPHIYRAFIMAGKSPREFTISSKCGDQLTSYYNGLNLRQAWAWNMYDSTGKQRAGVFTGAFTWEGNYQQCLDALGYHNNLKDFVAGTEVSAQYCSVYISTPSWVKELVDAMDLPFPPPHPPFIADVCTVVGCSETDIHNIVQTFVNKETWLGNYTVSLVKCQADLKLIEDPGSIVTLCIVAFILLLVVFGTTFELYLRAKRQGVKSSRDFDVGLDTDTETINLHPLPSTMEENEPKSTGYTNTAFTNDESDPKCQQTDSYHSEVKGVQFLSDNVPSSHDLKHINLSYSTDTINNTDTQLCDKEDNSVDGRSDICLDTNRNEESRGRKASRRLSELMIRSAARLKRSFKIKTNSTELPRMQKRHLKTQLSINEQTTHSKAQLLARCLVCFSIRRNLTNILGKGHLDTMFCINGIRVMSIGWIVLGSYYSALYSNPSYVDNHLDAVKMTQSFWIQAMINTTFAADSFFVLSGTLYAFNFMKQKYKQKAKKMYQVLTPCEYLLTVIHRLARIVPCFYFIVMIYTNLGPYFTAGSEYRSGLKSSTQCADHWWANVLFISNFYKSDKMCMAWTYYLVNDFQFSLLSPLVVIPLLCYPFIGFCIVVILIAVQIISVMVLNVGINGSVMRMGNTSYFSEVYVKPYCRVAPYAIGLALGYLLYVTERKVRLRKIPLYFGWFVCICLVATLPYITFTENKLNGHKWTDVERSLFEALSRPLWGLSVAWIIFACSNGQGGFISKLLSWNFFIPLCRITYGVYLIHPIFIEVILTSSHYNFFITFGEVTYGYISIMVSCWCLALLFMATVEQPFVGVESLITSHVTTHVLGIRK